MHDDLITDRPSRRKIQTWPRLLAAAVILALAALAMSITKAPAGTLKIVALGDSLTAGYGLPQGSGFAEQLEAALRKRQRDVEIVNAGVSGDTATAGLARFDWSVPEDAHGVIIELGANDALRGIDPGVTRKALDGILEKAGERGLPVLLAGMYAPPNLGEDYGAAFNAIYPELAEKHGVLLYPFFLDGVAAERALNLGDGIHPTAEGVGVIVQKILPKVEELLARVRRGENGE